MHPNIWYPYTQAKTAPSAIKVKSGKGAWLELENGRQILDCISSWWVNTHGHAHPQIAAAIYQQAQQLEQVIFSGFTHDPAEQLAERLVAKLPDGLERVFFSDNGSTAVEVALKMAYQYWVNQGKPRQAFLAFQGGYHGDTFGTMAVGGRSIFSEVFSDLLFEVDFVPFPATYWDDPQAELKEQTAIQKIEAALAEQPQRYAGILIEPLVQGAGGMQMCRPEFLQQLRQLAQQHNTLLIFDEVMTGFGRTGDWFACQRAQSTPDLICLSKGITGGFLPLAVTVCSEQIYQAFYSDAPIKTLYHGHSYTANPLGCAAALASLDLMAVNEPTFQSMEAQHTRELQKLRSHPRLEKLRVTGTIAAMDIVTPEQTDYLNPVGMQIRQAALERGLLLRPLGNVLYLMPPYCITAEELTAAYSGIESILTQLD
ncbi:adenosylmethionine--8-amino-7-oxononanoate transaminase [Romeria aff. gracilis LEGE 07310]|uniref:Adenosylmethionine-8-amino-7-oxononanoate aminotransferase n=1 Tax=Vasconcelosia minhoensis LEGE 07310 TaxID=915328 RepID=A0A8J7ABW7_9CYAN|nr:adenosylmethionine--8-amino-7-oxononanoate transaminase [Romeria gracilis]MBE9076799.1 adenosylmethionine--8-amino-7-oxononanoate transaminase [Romeria aff. gracilis LEGE 07310]